MAKSYFSDGPVTTTINQDQFTADVNFNGFAFDIDKGFFLNVPEKEQEFIKPSEINWDGIE